MPKIALNSSIFGNFFELISVNLKNKDAIGKIVCFGTSAMMKSMKKTVAKAADSAGISVADEEFHCRGSFGPMHKGRPNEKDLERVSAFAEKVIS